MWNNPGWGMGCGMWLIPLIALLVIYLLIKNNFRNKNGQSKESPFDILKERYAKGEITKEQFEEMKKNIS